jgi:hypothetical protein
MRGLRPRRVSVVESLFEEESEDASCSLVFGRLVSLGLVVVLLVLFRHERKKGALVGTPPVFTRVYGTLSYTISPATAAATPSKREMVDDDSGVVCCVSN